MEKKGKIIVFACSWNPYINADNAGARRVHYSSHIRIIRLACTGRITPALILRALQGDAIGVLVAGCKLGECHYIAGNFKCAEVVEETREILHLMGLNKERVRMELFSSAEVDRFVEVMNSFSKQAEEMYTEET